MCVLLGGKDAVLRGEGASWGGRGSGALLVLWFSLTLAHRLSTKAGVRTMMVAWDGCDAMRWEVMPRPRRA